MQYEIERQGAGGVVVVTGRIVARLGAFAIGKNQPVFSAFGNRKVVCTRLGEEHLAVIVIGKGNKAFEIVRGERDPRHQRRDALGFDHLCNPEFEFMTNAFDKTGMLGHRKSSSKSSRLTYK